MANLVRWTLTLAVIAALFFAGAIALLAIGLFDSVGGATRS